MQGVKIHLKGKVKETGFRYFVKQIANRNNIQGWVSYDRDDVVVKAAGSKENLNGFISRCLKGPPGCAIKEITISEMDFECPDNFIVID
ncbi:MAG: acylphosphatase [Bacteroidales bacterium]|nr:acylphosphatase [Bacteroidales bacterium]MCF8458991.1 acylphosphatase [Bacteroidales bacterium]